MQKWNKQRENPLNKEPLEKQDFYNEMKSVTFYGGNQPKCAVAFNREELNECAFKYLKTGANNAQNKLAARPDSPDANFDFLETQKELRGRRGSYIKEHLDDDDFTGIFELSTDYTGFSNYEVLFTVDDKIQIRAFVQHKNIKLENMTPNDITDILKLVETEGFDGVIDALKDLWTPGGKFDQTYFLGAEPRFNTARYAIKSGKNYKLKTSNIPFIYRFNINRMIPTKTKIYQNPLVVEKMITDFVNYNLPAMHVDLSVFYNCATEEKSKSNLVWTIHKLENHHNAIHMVVLENNEGFLQLPETLQEVRDQFQMGKSKISSFEIDSTIFTKPDDTCMLDLHAKLSTYFLRDMVKKGTDQAHPINFGYIYEYVPDYTIIASTLDPSSKTGQKWVTSYTIIHWNAMKKTQVNLMGERLKGLEESIQNSQVEIRRLTTGYDELSPYKQFGLQSIDAGLPSYIIPGIYDSDYAKNSRIDKNQKMGGYVLNPDLRTYTLLEHFRHRWECELLIQHILPFYNRDTTDCYTEMRVLVLEQFVAKENGRPVFIHVFPGFFGQLIMSIHRLGIPQLIKPIKDYTLKWNAFFLSRGNLVKRFQLEFGSIIAEIEDRKVIRKWANKPRRETVPKRAFQRPTFTPTWVQQTPKQKGKPTKVKESGLFHMDEMSKDMDAMGFKTTTETVPVDTDKTARNALTCEEIDTLKRTLNEVTLGNVLFN
jgi:hypothetical protein